MDKTQRLIQANEVIRHISEHGRRFFLNKETGFRTEFSIDARGHIYLTDHYTRKRIYMHVWRKPVGFTNGGTLWDLCKALRDYIRTGEKLWIRYFGDYWGYGDAMKDLHLALHGNDAIEFEDQAP